MRGVRRLTRVRPVSAGRHGLPAALAALAVVVAASTTASGVSAVDGPPAVAAGTTLPQVVPPTYTYLEAPGAPAIPGAPGSSTGTAPGGVPGSGPTGEAAPALASNGIPQRALSAYRGAAETAGCGMSWSLLAAIGRVESNHGRFAGATLLADGRSDPPIIGIPLDGRPGVATITDTDGGRYDGDKVYDRAVGPMQFIPGTWAMFATDGDDDGRSDPADLDDATAAAAEYLCRAGRDLSTGAGQQDAVYSYNRSDSYVRLVLDLAAEYERGASVDDRPAPDRTPQPLPPITTPTLPPVAVGPPPAITSPPAARPAPRPTPQPTTPAPTTTRPGPTTPAPTTTVPPTTTAPPSPTTPAPTTIPPVTPSPTCTPVPTPTPTPSGSVTPQATPTGTDGQTPTPTPTATPEASPAGTPTAGPTGTPTPSPTPTLPPCPTP